MTIIKQYPNNSKSERIDKIILSMFPHLSRNKIHELIKSGSVNYQGKRVDKASLLININTNINTNTDNLKSEIEIIDQDSLFVGRGAKKIQAAIQHFSLEKFMYDKVIADIGAGTGGFTDYLLSLGVKKAYTVDVGHGQLDPKLLANPCVQNFEGINIKDPNFLLPELVDLAVVDLSFISITKVLKNIFSLVKTSESSSAVICLYKPQFEVGKNALNKRGIVKNQNLVMENLENFRLWCKQNNYIICGEIPSPIKGKEGNQEYLFYLKIKTGEQ
ncbi:MAG: TlyA family RNA methyltransferase [Oligoflexia bacterium]|nr:TlyA family RNA methyltransferase [Oligoflexia bacterium]